MANDYRLYRGILFQALTDLYSNDSDIVNESNRWFESDYRAKPYKDVTFLDCCDLGNISVYAIKDIYWNVCNGIYPKDKLDLVINYGMLN